MANSDSDMTVNAASSSGAWLAFAAALVVGIGLLAFGLLGLSNGGGFLHVDYWWIACIGLGCLAGGALQRPGWQLSGLLAGLYIAGFSAQLALKDPFWFQQFRFSLATLSLPMMGVIALQGLVGAAVLLRVAGLGSVFRVIGAMGWFRMLLVVGVMVAASKAAMEFIAIDDLPRYVKQMAIALAFLGCNVLSLGAFVAALPEDALGRAGDRVRRLLTLRGSGETSLDRRLPILLSLFVLAITASISFWSFGGVPHLDGIVYLFHARYFADFALSLPVPPSVDAFEHYLMDIRGDRWFSVNLPGWPAALALGIWVGAPWLVNPVLAAISILLMHRFMKVMTDTGTANMVALLMAISPWYLSMSSTMLIHTFAYTMILGAWVLLLRSRETPSFFLAALAGALMGWLFLARPLEGLIIGGLTGLWTLTFLRDRSQWKTVVSYGAGCFAVGILFFLYNRAVTGSALTLPISSYLDRLWSPGANAIGFGANRGAPDWGSVDVFDGHSPMEALINFQQSLYELNMDLLGWGAASLFFVMIYLFWGRWTKLTVAMAGISLITILVYALYWYQGGFYAGPRYWFLLIVPMLIFSVLGMYRFADRLGQAFPERRVGERVGALVLLLGLCSVPVFESWLAVNKYPGINGYHGDYLEMSREEAFQNSLVFIQSEDHSGTYGSAFWVNDFAQDATTPLFAKDLGVDANRALAEAYPDRKIFVVRERGPDTAQVEIVRGPISATELQ